jgi:hypothetical protein
VNRSIRQAPVLSVGVALAAEEVAMGSFMRYVAWLHA